MLLRRAQGYGYGLTVEPGKADVEEDTFTCCHCNSVVFLKPREGVADAGGFCRMCMKGTCGPCADKGECTPFEKKLEEMESRDRFRRALTG